MSLIYKVKEGRDKRTREKFLKISPGKTIIVYDLETIGLNPAEDHILQFGGIKYLVKDNGEWETIDKANIFINPECHIPEEITKINHIDDEKVKDAPVLSEVIPRIKEMMTADFWCGQNIIGFDNKFILHQIYNYPAEDIPIGYLNSLDTLDASADLVSHRDCYQYNLKQVSKFFGIKTSDEDTSGFHDAIYDVQQCAELAKVLSGLYKRTIPVEEKGYINPHIKPRIYSIRPWRVDKKAYTHGNYIYVRTDCGTFRYNVYEQVWEKKDVFRPVSLQAFIEELYKIPDISCNNDLVYLEKKYPDGIKL